MAAVVALLTGYPWFAVGAGLVSLASFAWVLAFRFDTLQRSIESELQVEESNAFEKTLDALAIRLRADRDYRTKDALSIARASRESFQKWVVQSELPIHSLELQKKFDSLFQAFLDQLNRSLELFEQSDRLSGKSRDTILQERETCVAEIMAAANQLQRAAEHSEAAIRSRKDGDLAPLQEELEASLRIAKRVEERLQEWEESGPPPIRESQ